jgi:hypothetical protein
MREHHQRPEPQHEQHQHHRHAAAGRLAWLQRAVGNAAVARMVRAQRMPYSFGFDATDNLTQDQWARSGQATHASVHYFTQDGDAIALGIAKSNRSVTMGSEHAEDVVIRTIRNNLTMFDPAATNHLVITISKSPCTSVSRTGLPVTSTKAVGCAEELIALAAQGLQDPATGTRYTFQLDVICRGLYAPTVAGHAQQQVLAASQEAVNAMVTAGIQVSGDVRPSARDQRFGVT